MSYGTTFRKGVVTSGERMLDLYPKINQSGLPGVIYFHGAGSSAEYCLDVLGNQADLTSRIASRWPGISGGYGGDAWGNPASVTAAEAYRTRMRTRVAPSSSNYGSNGSSMGGLTALNHAKAQSTKPQAIVMIIPVINLDDVVTNNRGGFAAAINSAYGGAYNDGTQGDASNPYKYRADSGIAGIPMLIFYGATDAICLPAYTEAFAAADPSNRTLVELPGGHDFDTYAAVDHSLIIDFLSAHLS